jgi:glycosyltransferase involved in cell wall biosynthesis
LSPSGVLLVKILFVTREYPPFEVGGVAIHTFNLVKNLKKIGVSCRVLSFGAPSSSNEEVTFIKPSSSIIMKSDSSIKMDFKIPLDILRITRIANNLISKENFDVVHVEEPYVGAFVRHKRKITTIHDTSYGEIISILRQQQSFLAFKRVLFYFVMGIYLELMSIVSSRIIIAPSKQVAQELQNFYRVPKIKLRTIRNGVSLPGLIEPMDKAIAKEKLGLDAKKPLIFTAAQHIFRKRLDTMIYAIKLLRNQGLKDYNVVIAGDGPTHSILIKISAECGLTGTILFPGWVPKERLELYFKAADIFVLTSEYEAGPIALLEAMSYGDAVVSSKIQGFPSLMRQDFDGLLFPVGNHYYLSNSLKTLLKDPLTLMRLSTASRAFAGRFDMESISKETANLYESLL